MNDQLNAVVAKCERNGKCNPKSSTQCKIRNLKHDTENVTAIKNLSQCEQALAEKQNSLKSAMNLPQHDGYSSGVEEENVTRDFSIKKESADAYGCESFRDRSYNVFQSQQRDYSNFQVSSPTQLNSTSSQVFASEQNLNNLTYPCSILPNWKSATQPSLDQYYRSSSPLRSRPQFISWSNPKCKTFSEQNLINRIENRYPVQSQFYPERHSNLIAGLQYQRDNRVLRSNDDKTRNFPVFALRNIDWHSHVKETFTNQPFYHEESPISMEYQSQVSIDSEKRKNCSSLHLGLESLRREILEKSMKNACVSHLAPDHYVNQRTGGVMKDAAQWDRVGYKPMMFDNRCTSPQKQLHTKSKSRRNLLQSFTDSDQNYHQSKLKVVMKKDYSTDGVNENHIQVTGDKKLECNIGEIITGEEVQRKAEEPNAEERNVINESIRFKTESVEKIIKQADVNTCHNDPNVIGESENTVEGAVETESKIGGGCKIKTNKVTKGKINLIEASLCASANLIGQENSIHATTILVETDGPCTKNATADIQKMCTAVKQENIEDIDRSIENTTEHIENQRNLRNKRKFRNNIQSGDQILNFEHPYCKKNLRKTIGVDKRLNRSNKEAEKNDDSLRSSEIANYNHVSIKEETKNSEPLMSNRHKKQMRNCEFNNNSTRSNKRKLSEIRNKAVVENDDNQKKIKKSLTFDNPAIKKSRPKPRRKGKANITSAITGGDEFEYKRAVKLLKENCKLESNKKCYSEAEKTFEKSSRKTITRLKFSSLSNFDQDNADPMWCKNTWNLKLLYKEVLKPFSQLSYQPLVSFISAITARINTTNSEKKYNSRKYRKKMVDSIDFPEELDSALPSDYISKDLFYSDFFSTLKNDGLIHNTNFTF